MTCPALPPLMSFLSITGLFSFVSGGSSRGKPMALDASSSDTESDEKSSWVVDPLSRNDLEVLSCCQNYV